MTLPHVTRAATRIHPAQAPANGYTCLDWRTIMALGLSEAEAKAVVKTLAVRQLTKVYYMQLLRTGVASPTAMEIANAIAYYDTFGHLSEPAQLSLLQHHCAEICRAKLWRPTLFGYVPVTESL